MTTHAPVPCCMGNPNRPHGPAVRLVTYNFPNAVNKRTGKPTNFHYQLCAACNDRFDTVGRVADRAI